MTHIVDARLSRSEPLQYCLIVIALIHLYLEIAYKQASRNRWKSILVSQPTVVEEMMNVLVL